ncbi:MAG: hypothetical protein JXA14_07910 [Anaerolineae bacterium]|nr:hypothetical protein [Anaerolineae bacterium]
MRRKVVLSVVVLAALAAAVVLGALTKGYLPSDPTVTPGTSQPTPVSSSATPSDVIEVRHTGRWTTHAPENTVINALAVDGDYVWAGTNGDGLVRWNRVDGTHTWYTTFEGLVHDTVRVIAVDGDGHKWFGTEGGVSAFDGQAWTTYTTTHGLADSRVHAIAIGGDGRKWFGTWGGVSVCDGGVWTTYTRAHGLPSNHVHALAIDGDGHVWVGTPSGAAEFDGRVWRTYGTADGLVHTAVLAIAVDEVDHKWFATPAGVSEFDGRTWRSYTADSTLSDTDGLLSNHVRAMAIDGGESKWFATPRGVSVFDGRSWRTYTTVDGLPSSHVTAIAVDEEGHAWFGAIDRVIEFDGSAWTTHAHVVGSLVSKRVNAIAVDQLGQVWVGTDLGVSAFDGFTWRTYTSDDGLAADRVHAIAIDQKGHKWFGTRDGGVSEFDGRTWRTYTTTHGLASDRVYAIAVDEAGHKWFGTGGGVSEFDGQSWRTYTTAHGLASDWVHALAIDGAGHKWFGTWGGVSEFDGQSWRTYTATQDLSAEGVSALAVDDTGHKWFSLGWGGVGEFDGHTWRVYTESLMGSLVQTVAVDDAGHKWFGTFYNGLVKFDGRTWAHYGTTDGLAHDRVTAIAVDGAGHLWIGTYGGGVSEFDETASSVVLAREAPSAVPITPTLEATPVPPRLADTSAPDGEAAPFPSVVAQIELAPPGAQLLDLILDSAAGRVYVSDTGGQVHVLDDTTYEELAVFPGGVGWDTHMALDEANGRLYISGTRREPVLIVDTASLAIVGRVSPAGYVAVDSARNRFYVGNRLYDGTTLELVKEFDWSGSPIYNPLRDEILLDQLSVLAADPETGRIVRDLMPDITAQSCYDCGGTIGVGVVEIFPEWNLIVVGPVQSSPGHGGKKLPFRYFDATTLDELTDLASVPGAKYACNRLFLAEPVDGRVYREKIVRWYASLSNLLVYGPTGELETWRDGLYLGVTNPATGQMYVPCQDSLGTDLLTPEDRVLVLDLEALSPVGTLPAACIYTVDSEAGRIYGWRGGELVVFSERGGRPEPPALDSSGPLPGDEIKLIRVSPGYAGDRTIYVGAGYYLNQIYRSTDGGRTWARLRGGLPEGENLQLDLEISPDFARDGTLFVGGHDEYDWRGIGVYRSTNGGDTWQGLWNGLTHLRVYDVALSPNYTADGTLLAYTDYTRLASPSWEEGHSVFRSADRGLSWTLVASDTDPSWIRDGVPTPEELLPLPLSSPAVRFRVTRDSAGLSKGVERTADGGQTWEPITVTLRPESGLVKVMISPTFAADRTVYVLFSYDLFRSTDGGDTWERWRDERLTGRDYWSRLNTGAISPALEDGSHRLFVGTAAGEFWSLDPAALTWEPERAATRWPTILEDEQVVEIEAAPDGDVWLGTSEDGLVHYGDGVIQARYTIAEGLPGRFVDGIAMAPEGVPWVVIGVASGVGGGRVASFDGGEWVNHRRFIDEPIGHIGGIAVDAGGAVWVGGETGTILRWNGSQWEQIPSPSTEPRLEIYEIEMDSAGMPWCATNYGLFHYVDGEWLLAGGEGVEVRAIEFGPDGMPYYLSRGRVVWRYVGGEWTQLPGPVGTYHFRDTDALYVANDGAVWLGTGEGAFRYDGRTWQQLTAMDGLPGNGLFAIAEDADGWLWFGTNNGAACVDPATLAWESK